MAVVRLSLAEREEISLGVACGESFRAIARLLDRGVSTVSREVARNGGRCGYRAVKAQQRARVVARRPKTRRLVANRRLAKYVNKKLERRWSPEQIAWRLRIDYPDDRSWWVSHETIYQSLYVQSRGGLRPVLIAALRSEGKKRRARGVPETRGQIVGAVPISERPGTIEDRAVPGHWEGDLIMGKGNKAAVITLVERTTRFVMLAPLPDGHNATQTRHALAKMVRLLPQHLKQSLTWDRGKEMSDHTFFTVATGVQVYFCDPHSPWQRGTNENTNGLLRQYYPKGESLATVTQTELDHVAHQLNARPRKTLDWQTPAEKLRELLQ